MKNYNIYLTFALIIIGLQSLVAQDVSLTNANMIKPATGQEFGQACFTFIAEEGVAVTSIPVALEISMSRVTFDANNITGFNSDYFMWEVDAFAGNVIRGTLIDDIPDVDNGGGGAQICIPVKRTTTEGYDDSRNGYVVNIVPGSLDQEGNSGSDFTSRFGFSNPQNIAVADEEVKSTDKRHVKSSNNFEEEVTVFPNPSFDIVNVTAKITGNDYSLNIYDMTGKPQVVGMAFDGDESIEVQNWSSGMYLMEIQNNKSGEKSITRLMVSK